LDNQRLLVQIRASYNASGRIYGAKRVLADLREAGETCSRNRVVRLMRVNKIKAMRGYKTPRTQKTVDRLSQSVAAAVHRAGA
jgi:putative transposase